MAKETDIIEFEGVITKVVGGWNFKVFIEDIETEVDAYAAGKLKKFKIRMLEGDKVKVELSPYDPSKGRITFRLK